MALHNFKCLDCETEDIRIGGIDDHKAQCVACGGLMFRTDADPYAPYFQPDKATVGITRVIREDR